ncbi:Gamma-glutamyltransferase [Heterostelium album PN500]|uniref:Gamma-glutamyltransferase n=1 Tax=Heterostelium pallidum (strain ATCC 26659 / Pp 5 / PN500) TaxID=670386 RepID=D3B9J7_HETP5|nr:Gamma-glutamyltransferase [Heterostelium album PN500]EFA81909.1 Gamma-glutamyltransferase [Heterostelium album PN500]|eukprot:XP_020434026.1 Gamma-glutamyltransferase [Heterostelium album PN500]
MTNCYEVQFFVFAYVLEVNGEAKLAALPEESSGWYNKERFVSKEFMVVSAHPLATKAGYDIINMGGNAIDAMIAVQLVLNLVEPQSSGIGGGAFLLYYDSYSQRLTSYDGRETAPRRATETLFYNKTTSQPKSFTEALVGGSSVGVPGILDRLPQDKRIENELPNNVSFGAFNDFQPSEYQPTPRAMHLFAEACKLAFADRNRYLAEMDLNWDLLLDSDYLTTRASLIKDISMGQAPAGSFSRDQLLVNKSESGDQPPHEFPCTSHISIVDRDGNAISLTTSIEHEFGSSIMVEGFLLNNQLTDFNFIYYDDNTQCSFANKVRPNKRPRSSMSPTLIFKKYNDNNNRSQLVMSIGAAGGPLIPMVLGKSIIATLNWGISLQDSFNMVNFGSDNRFGLSAVEIGHLNQTFLTQLEQQFGQKIFQFGSPTGMQGFTYDTKSKTYIGASDPRKEGSAMGD